ncbi:hypothetical protein ACF3NS_15220 [Arsenicicoccus cauae]|uniref:hypothetical protein n=1 Tax=Arsenicicoccus cauae TaxID=2663847 RepID=UPI00370D20ED
MSAEWSAAWAAWAAVGVAVLVGLVAGWAGLHAKRAADVGRETLDVQEKERRERQASHVHVERRVHHPEKYPGVLDLEKRLVDVEAYNLSPDPVYNVRLGAWSLSNTHPQSGSTAWRWEPIERISPGEHASVLDRAQPWPQPRTGHEDTPPAFSVVFRDAQGRTWERWPNGKLAPADEDAYLPSTRPVG